MKNLNSEMELFNRKDLAKKLNVAPLTVAIWARDEGLPFIKIRGKFLYNWHDVKVWLASKTKTNKVKNWDLAE